MRFTHRSRSFDIEGVSSDDHIYNKICQTQKFYEIFLLEYINRIKSFFPSHQGKLVAVDIGANIGNHAVYLSTFVADHLIAFEPNPDVLPYLRQNLAANGCKCTVYAVALGSHEGKGAMAMPEGKSDNIGSAKVDVAQTEGSIEIKTLDSIIGTWRTDEENKPPSSLPIGLIKIDVEGMEAEVLRGATSTIKSDTPHIFAEAATPQELERISNLLAPLGYRKMPGTWAATPVYHFAHKPPASLYVIAGTLQLKKHVYDRLAQIRRFRRRITGQAGNT
jgi:FkbM family methyltransferase